MPTAQNPRFERYRKEVRELFAANLRRLREAQGLSQEKLAERADLSLHYVQRLEWAKHSVPLDTVSRLAFALRCEPGALLAPLARAPRRSGPEKN